MSGEWVSIPSPFDQTIRGEGESSPHKESFLSEGEEKEKKPILQSEIVKPIHFVEETGYSPKGGVLFPYVPT